MQVKKNAFENKETCAVLGENILLEFQKSESTNRVPRVSKDMSRDACQQKAILYNTRTL